MTGVGSGAADTRGAISTPSQCPFMTIDLNVVGVPWAGGFGTTDLAGPLFLAALIPASAAPERIVPQRTAAVLHWNRSNLAGFSALSACGRHAGSVDSCKSGLR